MSKKLWGGRFTKETDKDFFEFQKSIRYDYKLADYDILHSILHASALEMGKILTKQEKDKLSKALKEIRAMIKDNRFIADKSSEDIHTDIQNKIEKKLGDIALKLQTFRSRNGQIVFDEKGYCHDKAGEIEKLLLKLLSAIEVLQNKYKSASMVGYTHTQRAQKIKFKDYAGAYYSMFERDNNRIANFRKDLVLYMGGGGLAGSPVNGKYTNVIKSISEVFSIKPSVNVIDEISDRDFIVELLGNIAIIQMHLSRMAEDLILYSTKEFGFVELPEEFCTGSSLMPHKKNADFLELVRGYTGKIYGNLVSILVTMKGLPLTYNKDMQLDKEPLFSSVEVVEDELKIMGKFVKGIELDIGKIEAVLKNDKDLSATEEVYKLVINKKIPFKKAHDLIGRSIKNKERYARI